MAPQPVARDIVFVSYSHRDAAVLKRLQQFLAPLERAGVVHYWDDTQIAPGMVWRDEIAKALSRARVAILLVSADFMASKFIVENELPPLLDAAAAGGARVLPVIVGPSCFAEMPGLSRFQAVNSPEKPLKKLLPVQREEVLLQLSNTVANILGGASKDTIRDAARQGDSEAQYVFARLKGTEAAGDGSDSSEKEEAVKWLRDAAEAGNVGAQAELGTWYITGLVTEKNPREGLGWLRRAAEKGHPQALYNLAILYAKGQVVEQDYQSVEKLLTEAAEQGHAGAQYYIGQMYRTGEGGVVPDLAKARIWYLKAAESGMVDAQNNIGALCHLGLGGAQDDVESVKWFRKAAEQGDASAQHNLALMYRNGHGVPQDDREALKWHYKAAEQGYAQSEGQIGIHFANGWGVPVDPAEAVRWFQKAAEKGDSQAEFNLGMAYGKGLSGEADYAKALHWIRQASGHGNENANKMLASLIK